MTVSGSWVRSSTASVDTCTVGYEPGREYSHISHISHIPHISHIFTMLFPAMGRIYTHACQVKTTILQLTE